MTYFQGGWIRGRRNRFSLDDIKPKGKIASLEPWNIRIITTMVAWCISMEVMVGIVIYN